MNSLDLYIQNYFSMHRTLGLTQFMYIVSKIFDLNIYSVSLFLCFLFLMYAVRGKRQAGFFVFNIIFTLVSVYILKMIFNTSRPLGGVMYAFGASFPSYHATISTVFFIMIYYIFNPISEMNGLVKLVRKSEAIFSFLMVFLVSFSRIYLGVHWFSDVIFGVIWGLFIFYFSKFLFKKYNLL